MSTKLAPIDGAICARLREARERITGLSQPATAKQLGIPRETLLMYEYGRAPVRHEFALRFCRQFIISEEWLATGKNLALEDEAVRGKGFKRGSGLESLAEIFERQLVDLQAEDIFHQVPPRSLFGSAWTEYYAPVYRQLIKVAFYAPRLVARDSDRKEVLANYFGVCFNRWLHLLSNEADNRDDSPGFLRRWFLRTTFETNSLIFQACIGTNKPNPDDELNKTLHAVADGLPIGPLASKILAAEKEATGSARRKQTPRPSGKSPRLNRRTPGAVRRTASSPPV